MELISHGFLPDTVFVPQHNLATLMLLRNCPIKITYLFDKAISCSIN